MKESNDIFSILKRVASKNNVLNDLMKEISCFFEKRSPLLEKACLINIDKREEKDSDSYDKMEKEEFRINEEIKKIDAIFFKELSEKVEGKLTLLLNKHENKYELLCFCMVNSSLDFSVKKLYKTLLNEVFEVEDLKIDVFDIKIKPLKEKEKAKELKLFLEEILSKFLLEEKDYKIVIL